MTISLRSALGSNYSSSMGMGILDYLKKNDSSSNNSSLFTQYSSQTSGNNSNNQLLNLLSGNSNSSAASLWSTYNQYGKVSTQTSSAMQPPALTDSDSETLAALIKQSDINKDGKLNPDDIAKLKSTIGEQIKTLQGTKSTSIAELKKNQSQIQSLGRQANYVNYIQQNYSYLSKTSAYSNTLA